MKKILYIALIVALVLPSVSFAATKKKEKTKPLPQIAGEIAWIGMSCDYVILGNFYGEKNKQFALAQLTSGARPSKNDVVRGNFLLRGKTELLVGSDANKTGVKVVSYNISWDTASYDFTKNCFPKSKTTKKK